MVTLLQYDEFTDKKYNQIEKFNSFLADFNNGWNCFLDEDEEYRIKKALVIQFFFLIKLEKIKFPRKGETWIYKKICIWFKII